MPIKTEYLCLDKLQTNEYYNSDIENANLDKIDSKLKNHEERTASLESQISRKDQLIVELSSSNRSRSISDSFGGSCDFEVEGKLIGQYIVNGDFRKKNGDTPAGWDIINSPMLSNTDDEQIIENQDGIGYRRLKYHFDAKNGHKYAMIVKLKRASGSGAQLFLYSGNTAEISNDEVFDSYHTIVKTITANDISSSFVEAGVNASIGKMSIKHIMVINLTESCLEDRSSDELSEMFNNYFEGIQPTRGISIKSVGKNLIDESIGIVNKASISDEGLIIADSDFSYDSKFYPVLKGKTYTLTSASNTANRLCIYDENKQFIRSVSSPNNSISEIFESNGFIRYAFNSSEKGTLMFFEESELPSNYKPYKSSKIVLKSPLASLSDSISDKIVRKNGRTSLIEKVKKYRLSDYEDWYNFASGGSHYRLLMHPSDILDFNTENLSRLRSKATCDDSIFRITASNPNLSYYIGKHVFYPIAGGYIGLSLAVEQVDAYTGKSKGTSTLDDCVSYLKDKNAIAYMEYNSPRVIDLADELETINSQDGYTQFCIDDGVVENEKVIATTSDSHDEYYVGIYGHHLIENSNTRYKIKKIDDVVCDGRSIMSLGEIKKSNLTYGVERWAIKKDLVDSQNIDIQNLRIDYTTSECNGQAIAQITYNADISNAIFSNSNAISSISNITDKNTHAVNELSNEIVFKPTLLNGAEDSFDYGIRVVNGYLEAFGVIGVGTLSNSQVFMNTGKYSVGSFANIPVQTNSLAVNSSVFIQADGTWKLLFNNGTPTYFDLSQIRFKIGE